MLNRFFLFILIIVIPNSIHAQIPEFYIQTGHKGQVHALAYSPDGNFIASGGEDRTVKLWNAVTGKEIRTFKKHGSTLMAVAFSPDGKSVASADTVIRIWHIENGQETFTIRPQLYPEINEYDYYIYLRFSPDGKKITAGFRYTHIVTWDIVSGKIVGHIKDYTLLIESLCYSPDNKYLSVGTKDSAIRIYDVNSFELIKSHKIKNKPYRLAFTPDNKYLISSGPGGGDFNLYLWDFVAGKLIRTFSGHSSYVNAIRVSADGKNVISASNDCTVRIWDILTGKENRTCRSRINNNYTALALSPDKKTFASGDGGGKIKIWDVTYGQEISRFDVFCGSMRNLKLTPDGRFLSASFSFDNSARLWNLKKGYSFGAFGDFRGYHNMIFSISDAAVSPDGRYVAVSNSIDLKIWDVISEKLVKNLDTSFCKSIHFSPDGKYLAATGNGIRIFNTDTWVLVREIQTDTKLIRKSSFSPEGKYFAYSGNHKIILYDTQTWQVALKIEDNDLYGDDISAGFTFSPDSRYLAADASLKLPYKVKIWNLETGAILNSYNVSDPVVSIKYSPDGSCLALGGMYGSVKILNAVSGNTISEFKYPVTWPEIEFIGNDRLWISSIYDYKITLWNLKQKKELAVLMNLDSNEWAVVAPDGRFDASLRAMKRMYYVQGLNTFPLENFFDKFYTPNLLGAILSVKEDIGYKSLPDFTKPLKLPPVVKIISPKENSIFTAGEIEIQVEAADMGGGVDEIRLFLNGKLISEEQRGMKNVQQSGEKISRSYRLALISGKNEIKATAFNNDRTEAIPHIVTVELKQAEAVANMYLLAVGINEYKNPQYKLNYGKPDAESFSALLEEKSKNIFRQINQQVICDKNADKANIIAALDQIAASAQPQDVFVFFYAGHGVMSDGDENTASDFFIVPYDVTQMYGRDEMLQEKGLSAKDLKEWCRKIKAQKQLILIDACQSGGAVESFSLRGASEEKAIMQLGRSTGVMLFASTGSQQFATEFSELNHGVFTYALIQGLKGEADGGTKDGKITIKELDAFLNDKVPELTAKYRGAVQYPKTWSTGMDWPVVMIH